MSVIAHQTEKEWISANEKSRQRMSQTQAEGAAKQHAARLEEAHFASTSFVFYNIRKMLTKNSTSVSNMTLCCRDMRGIFQNVGCAAVKSSRRLLVVISNTCCSTIFQ
ncbi:hypothetical protein TNCV_848371 [Trichonephila clavipes]|uniref:Uncharacterized protein n=1 Tax=Trichonephila clavipes TaxID=2585209 RepID=A0A8X6RH92_TRICX|nr:hypothetical protein TNCV_848371 [Trichonephila clavipes]